MYFYPWRSWHRHCVILLLDTISGGLVVDVDVKLDVDAEEVDSLLVCLPRCLG